MSSPIKKSRDGSNIENINIQNVKEKAEKLLRFKPNGTTSESKNQLIAKINEICKEIIGFFKDLTRGRRDYLDAATNKLGYDNEIHKLEAGLSQLKADDPSFVEQVDGMLESIDILTSEINIIKDTIQDEKNNIMNNSGTTLDFAQAKLFYKEAKLINTILKGANIDELKLKLYHAQAKNKLQELKDTSEYQVDEIVRYISDETTKSSIILKATENIQSFQGKYSQVNNVENIKDFIKKIEAEILAIEAKDRLVELQPPDIQEVIKYERVMGPLENEMQDVFNKKTFITDSLKTEIKKDLRSTIIKLREGLDPLDFGIQFSQFNVNDFIAAKLDEEAKKIQEDIDGYLKKSPLPSEAKTYINKEVTNCRQAYKKACESGVDVDKALVELHKFKDHEKATLPLLKEFTQTKSSSLKKDLEKRQKEIVHPAQLGDNLVLTEINKIQTKFIDDQAVGNDTLQNWSTRATELVESQNALNQAALVAAEIEKISTTIARLRVIKDHYNLDNTVLSRKIDEFNLSLSKVSTLEEAANLSKALESLNQLETTKSALIEKFEAKYEINKKKAENIVKQQTKMLANNPALNTTKVQRSLQEITEAHHVQTASWEIFKEHIQVLAENEINLNQLEEVYNTTVENEMDTKFLSFQNICKEEIDKVVEEKYTKFMEELANRFLTAERAEAYTQVQLKGVNTSILHLKISQEKNQKKLHGQFEEHLLDGSFKFDPELAQSYKDSAIQKINHWLATN